jgi:hypothetical protein
MKRICRTCKAEVEPGTLLTHVRTEHPEADRPAAAKRARPCYAAKCVDFYGRSGHIVGVDGPHAH